MKEKGRKVKAGESMSGERRVADSTKHNAEVLAESDFRSSVSLPLHSYAGPECSEVCEAGRIEGEGEERQGWV